MSVLSTSLREDARQQRAAADVLLKSDDFSVNPARHVQATAGLVTGAFMDVVADLVDYLESVVPANEATAKRRAILETNDAIRRAATHAAATGDWTEFDRMTDAFGVVTDEPSSRRTGGGGKGVDKTRKDAAAH